MQTPDRLRVVPAIIVASLILGVLGIYLIGPGPWGFGFPVFCVVLVLASAMLYSQKGVAPLTTASRNFLFLAFPFALFMAWRDSAELRFLDGVALALILGWSAVRGIGGNLAIANLMDIPGRALAEWIQFLNSFFHLIFTYVPQLKSVKTGHAKSATAVIRGLALAAPILLVFGGLLVSADQGFEHLVTNLFTFDPASLFNNTIVFTATTILCGGMLTRFLARPPADPATPPPPSPPYVLAPHYHPPFSEAAPIKLGVTEIGIVLGTMNLLFAIFVLLQAPYLFGGASHLFATKDLAAADYARRGFFELVWIVGLAIPILLGSHALLREASRGAVWTVRALSVAMVSLLFAMMASAAQRMSLYVDIYSLSTLRVYVCGAMVFMAGSLVWFLATTVRGRQDRFAFGSLIIFLAVVVGLNFMSPDATVARVNLAKPIDKVDVQYLTTLSADAAWDLSKGLDRLKPADQGILAKRLLELSNDDHRNNMTVLDLVSVASKHDLNELAKRAPEPKPSAYDY